MTKREDPTPHLAALGLLAGLVGFSLRDLRRPAGVGDAVPRRRGLHRLRRRSVRASAR
jgi:hypothetical protein